MKKLLLFLFILLFISADSNAQVTNLIINGQSSNFNMASGDLLSWSYNVPLIGDTTNIEFWFDTDQNGILNPSIDVLWQSLIQTDGITNSQGQNAIPDMDGTPNGQVSLNINVGLAPSHYILVFKNHNNSQTIIGTVFPMASPAFTISGNVSVPSGFSKQNIALTLQNNSNGGGGQFWDALTDINGDFIIRMNSDTSGNPWNLSIDNKEINNSFLVSPNHYSLNINPNTASYTGNNFNLSTPVGITNLTVNGSGSNFNMVSGGQFGWSYNVPVVGDSTYIEIWIDTDQDGNLNPSSDILWQSFAQVDGLTNIRNGLPDMDGSADGHVFFQQNIGMAPAHYIMAFKNHNNTKLIAGTVASLPSPAFIISGNITVPEGVNKQFISLTLQNHTTNGGNKFWDALTDNNGNFSIQMDSDTSGNPWSLSLDNNSGQFICNPGSYSLFINPNSSSYPGNNFVLSKGSNNKNITVTTPNGGEIWKPGENKTIFWNMSGISNVKIEFTTNKGNSWNVIVESTPPNQCFYNWTIPSVNSRDCFIKISDASDNSVSDMSNNNFIIYQPTVVSQFSGMGQNSLNFGDTFIFLDLYIMNPDQITATLFDNEAPQPGALPNGIISCSPFYWTITTTGNIIFNNGFIKIPLAILQQIGDPSQFVWMKRENSGDAWTNIGGLLTDGNLVSTVPFASFCEFALGTKDDALPVELSSFLSVPNGRTVQLNWSTKTEKNSDKFILERKTISTDWSAIGSVTASQLSNSPKQYSFTDKNLQPGKYQYRIKMLDNNGTFEYSKVIETEVALPKNYDLSQNFPNPFNPSTVIRYTLPFESNITIRFYNSLGQLVSEVNQGNRQPGYYDVNFNSAGLSSGVYLYTIHAVTADAKNNFTEVKKMIIMK